MRRMSVRKLTLGAVLVAMQVILARYAGIQVNEGLRISLETVPIILAGFWLGPVAGMAVGGVADVIGTILSGYGTYFPLLTVGPMLLGALCGLGARWLPAGAPVGWRYAARFLAVARVAEALNSLLYGTWALTLYYSIIVGREVPFSVLFLGRLATKPVTMAADLLLSYSLYRLLYRQLRRLPDPPALSDTAALRKGSTGEKL